MEQQSCDSTGTPGAESGMVIILFTFALLALGAVVALVVDTGNLYRHRLALQNAVDAAALSTVGHIIQRGRTEVIAAAGGASNLDEYLRIRARRSVEANLEHLGFNRDPDTGGLAVTTGYEQNPSSEESLFKLRVHATHEVKHLLIDLIPFELLGLSGAAHVTRISAQASADRKIANISLILDVSDSMGCPAEGDCRCRTRERTEGVDCPTPQKVDKLIEAARAFVKQFDYRNDRLSFVPFNTAATSFTLTEVAGGLTLSDAAIDLILDEIRQEYRPSGSTNICDAFMRAHRTMEDLSGGKESAYVFFSDGAPTAGRFLFSNPTGLAPWSIPLSGGTHDYLHYTVQWVQQEIDLAGPSVLMQTDLVEIGHDEPQPPGDYEGIHPDAKVATCGPATNPPVSSLGGTASASQQVFGNCLANLGFHMPDEAGTTYGAGAVEDPTFVDWRKQYYHCAIQLSDYLRSERGIVYVVGYGPPGGSSNDPYQEIEDTLYRKDVFLSRVANDYAQGIRQNGYPPFPYSGYRHYQRERRTGDYLATHDIDELKVLFQKIALKIKLRLIE